MNDLTRYSPPARAADSAGRHPVAPSWTRTRRNRRRPTNLRPFVIALVVGVIGGLIMSSELVLGGGGLQPAGKGSTPAATTTAPTASPTSPPGPPVPTGVFDTRTYTDATGASMTYYLYGPSSYSPSGHYPLVVVLHGGGERADPSQTGAQNRDVVLRQAYVTAFTDPDVQTRWPCFVVVPQAPLSQRWVQGSASVSSYTLAPKPTQALSQAMEIVNYLRQVYPAIDTSRLYIGGISMGAFGTWEALERWPDTFAAGFPIAGAGDVAEAARVQAPVWAFHGSGDALVPVEGSRLMVQAVLASGGRACYTEYPGAPHDIWLTERPLSQLDILRWLFSHVRRSGGTIDGVDCSGRTPRQAAME